MSGDTCQMTQPHVLEDHNLNILFLFSVVFPYFYFIFLGEGTEEGAVLGQVTQTSKSWV
jgi:hypothetical protein